MKRWDLAGAEADAAGALEAVRAFCAALARGDLAAARAQAAPGFAWFGHALDAAAWSSPAARDFFAAPLAVHEVRGLPAEVARALPDVDALIGGPLGPDARLGLADVTRDARRVTLGMVVVPSSSSRASSDWAIARVFDPTALGAAVQARAAGGEPA